MDTDRIKQQLNQRFAVPLPEFYHRRIIFWHDEEREYASQLDDIILDNAKMVVLNQNNLYSVKKLLCADDLESNYLVYTPLSFEKDDDNWLINVEIYSEEYRADMQSLWIEEMNLPITSVIREQLKKYKKFFGLKKYRTKIAAFSETIMNASQMQQAIMAVLCGNKDIQPNNILKAMLRDGLTKETNSIYQDFINYSIQDAFWMMAADATGYGEEDPQLDRLAAHILLTASSRTLNLDNMIGMDGLISEAYQSYCYDFISDWLYSSDKDSLYEISRYVEDEIQLPERLSNMTIDELINTECFPCVNECILSILMTEISEQIIQVDKIRSVVEKRRALAWYDQVSWYYEAVLQVANMQEFYLDHASGFHTVEPERVWKEYTQDYYKMDMFYRLFQCNFQAGLCSSEELLDDLFKQVADQVEALYANWFLGQLNGHWSEICADQLKDYGRIMEIPQQVDFYRDQVQDAGNRVYVIISDALRFEVAVSLAEQLRRETRSSVTIDSCEALFPTATKFGMAALLPHKKLSAKIRTNGTLAILADGKSTEANNREQVLQDANPKSVALKYEDLVKQKRAERQESVKGMDVVYIYHDKIDSVSHVSDDEVFPACNDAINEIKNMVRIIVNEFSGTHIIITADHGFLYTYQPLREDSKVGRTTRASQEIEVDRRYMITKKGTNPEYLLPVKFLDGNTDFDAYAPRETVRIKKKGGGMNYVHGGISLEEMVVPVITYHHMRTDSKSYQRNRDKIDTKPVELQLLSSIRKINNRTFSLNFYQKDPVGDNRAACNYQIYFVDSEGTQISDMQRVIADKTTTNGQERTYRCNFTLRAGQYNSRESYYMVIADESGVQLPVREEFSINII